MLTNFFTKSSGLKLFLLIYVLPLLLIITISRFSSSFLITIPIFIIIVGQILWLYLSGSFAFQKSISTNGLKLISFKISIVIVALWLILIFLFETTHPIIHILFGISYLYIIYFFAKALTSAEVKKETTFMTYFGTFIFIYMAPIGILLVQSRIQRLHDSL